MQKNVERFNVKVMAATVLNSTQVHLLQMFQVDDSQQGLEELKELLQIEQHIEQACSLTRGDVQAVMTSLHDLIVTELSQGARFYLPQVGYLSLSVTTELPEGKSMDKVTGNNIRLRNINFKPTAELLNEVGRNVRFERSKYTTKSRRYTEEQLWDKIVAFIKEHDYICRRDMEYHFSLRQQTALKWLKHFTEKGLLVKEGARNAPIYFLAKDNKDNKGNEEELRVSHQNSG